MNASAMGPCALACGMWVELMPDDSVRIRIATARYSVRVRLPDGNRSADVRAVGAAPAEVVMKAGDRFYLDTSSRWCGAGNVGDEAPPAPPKRGPREIEAAPTDLKEERERAEGCWVRVRVTGGSRGIGGPEAVENGDVAVLPPGRAKEWIGKGWGAPADAESKKALAAGAR